jgi:hypothetical protein
MLAEAQDVDVGLTAGVRLFAARGIEAVKAAIGAICAEMVDCNSSTVTLERQSLKFCVASPLSAPTKVLACKRSMALAGLSSEKLT